MAVSKVSANLGLPFGMGGIAGEWEPQTSERDAAWELYVELITRIGVVDLRPSQGLIREALTSLYSLFETTREILRRYGPVVARPASGSSVSFGHLAVAVLNHALRPLLAEWHPLLTDYEAQRPEGVSQVDWEREWNRSDEARRAIADVGHTLKAFAGLLGEVCEAKDLLKLVGSDNHSLPSTDESSAP